MGERGGSSGYYDLFDEPAPSPEGGSDAAVLSGAPFGGDERSEEPEGPAGGGGFTFGDDGFGYDYATEPTGAAGKLGGSWMGVVAVVVGAWAGGRGG